MADQNVLYNPNALKLGIFSLLFALILVATFVIIRKRRQSSRKDALLFLGPTDGGKTSILSTLVYNQTLPTHTSLQVNSSAIVLPEAKKAIRLVDVPGHPRIRDQFREHLNDAKAIAFVVDSSTISRNGPAVAEHLHVILHTLSSFPPSQTPPTIIILAHKADLLRTAASTTAPEDLAVNRVKSILERELEKRRLSQAKGVGIEGLGEEGERTDMGGLDCVGTAGGVFRFANWEAGEIPFIGTSVAPGRNPKSEEKAGVDGLQPLWEWILDNM